MKKSHEMEAKILASVLGLLILSEMALEVFVYSHVA